MLSSNIGRQGCARVICRFTCLADPVEQSLSRASELFEAAREHPIANSFSF